MYKKAIEYLPHDRPMVFLDDVKEVDDTSCVCSITIKEDGLLKPFFKNNKLDTLFGIEMMAQCIGVWSGFHQGQDKEHIKLGMLIGVSGVDISQSFFQNNKEYLVFAKLIMVDGSFGSFNCSIEICNQVVMSATINTYQIEDFKSIENL